jgi:conjugative transfer signal peptidase TraF
MSRSRAVVLAICAAGCLTVLASWMRPYGPTLLFNTTASAPIGFYWLDRRAPRIGDLVVVRPPPALADWMARRGYLPRGVPLLKVLAASAGARVCVADGVVYVADQRVAWALEKDRWGRSLTPWTGCRDLLDDEIFLLNAAAPASLDGRYFGPLSRDTIVAVARPLWTWAR